MNRNRFSDYQFLIAKSTSEGSCGHPIQAGDQIGWNPYVKKALCAACWKQWVTENASADFDDANNRSM